MSSRVGQMVRVRTCAIQNTRHAARFARISWSDLSGLLQRQSPAAFFRVRRSFEFGVEFLFDWILQLRRLHNVVLIKSLRTKIERIEQQAIEEFNEHMEMMLETLEYDNLARIWLERTETEVREGRRKRTKGVFDLHIIRQTDSRATYEDRVENLSESEREVTRLVFALAGYLAHEVHETVPFMLLDSLEAIDSERIETLVEYLAEYSEYLVVALLPEDAQEIGDDYRQITEI